MTLTGLSSCLYLPNPEITGVCYHVFWLHPHAFLNLVRAPFPSTLQGTRLTPPARTTASDRETGDSPQSPVSEFAASDTACAVEPQVTTPGAAGPLVPRCPTALSSPRPAPHLRSPRPAQGVPRVPIAPLTPTPDFPLGPHLQPDRGLGAARQHDRLHPRMATRVQGTAERARPSSPGVDHRPRGSPAHPADGPTGGRVASAQTPQRPVTWASALQRWHRRATEGDSEGSGVLSGLKPESPGRRLPLSCSSGLPALPRLRAPPPAPGRGARGGGGGAL